jgi:hypothetical protein
MWWFPRALPTLLRWGDVEVAEVQRLPAGRLRLTEVLLLSGDVCVTVDTLEMPGLHQYLWECFSGELSEDSLVTIDRLQLKLPEIARDDEDGELGVVRPDLASSLRLARELLQQYGQWVPPIEIGELSVSSAVGDLLLCVKDVHLRDWHLGLQLVDERLPEVIDLQASLAPEADWSARLRAPQAGLDLEVLLNLLEEYAELSFSLRRADESAVGFVFFEPGQWRPVRAQLQSDLLSIDAEWLPALELLQVDRAALSAVELCWERGRYTGQLAFSGDVLARDQPPASFAGALEFSGDFEHLRLDVLEVSADWGQLHLEQPVEIDLQDGSVERRAEFLANVDLSRQSYYPSTGELAARLSLAPSASAGANVQFEFSASDLVVGSYQIAQIDLAGGLAGAALSVDELRIQSRGDDDSEVLLRGVAELSTQTLDLEYEASLEPGWLQTLIGIESVQISNRLEARGQITGTVARPIIAGEVEALTFRGPGLRAITFSGSYHSESWDQWSLAARVQAAGAVIDASLDVGMQPGRVVVDLLQFIWSDPSLSTLVLQAPTRFSYQYEGAAAFPESRIAISPVRLVGPGTEISGHWDFVDGLDLQVSHVPLQRFASWVDRELPELTIESVDLSLAALRPQILGSLGMKLETRAVEEAIALRLDLEAELNEMGLVVDTVELDFEGAPLLAGVITAPVSFQIPETGKLFWQLLDQGALMAQLTGSVTPTFAEWLFRVSGFQVGEAALDLNVAGSLFEPTGRLSLKVGSLESAIAGVPAVEQLDFVAKADVDRVQVERVNFVVNNSQVSGNLSLPTDGLFHAVIGTNEARRELFSRGSGSIELIDWQVEDWVGLLPPVMRRSGRVSGFLDLQPDWELRGRLSFQDFSLRPQGSLPSVDLIGGEVELFERRFTVNHASAQMGGSPVSFTGWLDLNDLSQPLWDFAVSGDNVPLARTTDMILRSDLELRVSHTQPEDTPMVSGALNLRSSTMLVEFDPLAPNVASGPQATPPYFTITEPSLADWRFDLQIAGNSFMRVRSPYFQAQLTANFDLGGTFSEPLLLGSVLIEDGELRFPGAKVRITSGEAYIEQSRPYVVQLNLTGIAQRASYVITMDVSQTLDNPQIHFQSTPTLSNASIVRLLTTGSLSGGGSSAVGLYLGQGLLGAGGLDDQLSDRLTVDVGEETSRNGGNTVDVRYDLSKDVFLEGGYDVYDAYNLDLIWSLFKR